MWYVLLTLLGLFLFVIFVATVALWAKTTVILLYKNKRITVTFKLLGLQFSKEYESEQVEEVTEHETEEVETDVTAEFKSQLKSDLKSIQDDSTFVDLEALKSVAQKYYDYFRTGKSIVLQFLGRLRYRFEITKIELKMNYGLGDPGHTGMAYGAIWGAAGILYPLLREYFHIVFPVLDLNPDFNQKKFELEGEGIIRVRAAHIINAAILTVFNNYKELRPLMASRKKTKNEA